MALAALGDPARFRALFTQAVPSTDDGFAVDPRWFGLRVLSSRATRLTPRFIDATCPARRPAQAVGDVHADLAAALQERTEQVMLDLAHRARQATTATTLCMGGGVAMNCVSIGRVSDAELFDTVCVPPAPGDSGTAIGAAIAVSLREGNRTPDGVAHACYLGPRYTTVNLPDTPRPGMSVRRVDNQARFLAEQLATGTIAGVFTGALEAGPRALGNRSILASPLKPDVVDRLNRTVKFREPFRPFAPVVLADKAADYFRLRQPSPYMSRAVPATDHGRSVLPAIVHANGTARVQTVTEDANPFLANVLGEFHAITGIPVLINTSLNIKGKPICGTPDMALDCLAESGIDALLLEGWWITR